MAETTKTRHKAQSKVTVRQPKCAVERPLFGEIRGHRENDKDVMRKPGPRKKSERTDERIKLSAVELKEEARYSRQIYAFRKSLKATDKDREEAEDQAMEDWEKRSETFRPKKLKKLKRKAKRTLKTIVKDQLDLWMNRFGPPSIPQMNRFESDIKFMFKFPDKEPIFKP